MSLDLDFWKYKEGCYGDHQEVYLKACCNGETLDILEELPTGEILKELAAVFSEWRTEDPLDYEKEGCGAFTVYTTGQIVRFDCCGMNPDDMNRLMDVMFRFDCPLYDPQISTRFDGD